MMDCKKALTETDGDMDRLWSSSKRLAARLRRKQEELQQKVSLRLQLMAKRAVVEVNSETDFVAKNAIFQEFVQAVADKALTVDTEKAGDGEDVVSILDMKADLDDKILKIGEKILHQKI